MLYADLGAVRSVGTAAARREGVPFGRSQGLREQSELWRWNSFEMASLQLPSLVSFSRTAQLCGVQSSGATHCSMAAYTQIHICNLLSREIAANA